MLKLISRGLATVTVCVGIIGCAGPGELMQIPVNMGSGHTATIYAHNQQVPSWLLATDTLTLNYIVKGNQTQEQLLAVAGAEKACRLYTKTSRPNELVAVIANTAVYAGMELPFAMYGATLFKGAKVLQYGGDAAAEEAGGGSGNGIIQMGGKVYTFQNCGHELFELFKIPDIQILQTSTY